MLLHIKYKIAGYNNHGEWWGYRYWEDYFVFNYGVDSYLVHFS